MTDEIAGRLTVERLPSDPPEMCPEDGLPCFECPSYCLEVYGPDAHQPPDQHGADQ